MELPTYFEDLLSEVRPTAYQLDDYRAGHTELRTLLNEDLDLRPLLIGTFLQGSYRRATAVRPEDGELGDVDIVVATKLDAEACTPQEALERFRPFVRTHYGGKYRYQGRSIGIQLTHVQLDLVVTSAPSEAEATLAQADWVYDDDTPDDVEEWPLDKALSQARSGGVGGTHAFLRKVARGDTRWKHEPLLIPDREASKWEKTHPLEQICWTWDKNSKCNGHYVNVVKAIKWWRRERQSHIELKSYPLEHLVGECCPDGIGSVAQGVAETLEEIGSRYQSDVNRGAVPVLYDRGVRTPVLRRTSGKDFAEFHAAASAAAEIARRALNIETSSSLTRDDAIRQSAEEWRRLFGDAFPLPRNGSGEESGGYTPRTKVSKIRGERFA
jgi:hypothetical protein